MRLDAARSAVAIAMFDLERRIKAEGRVRNTTARIYDEMVTTVDVGAGYVEGSLLANDYWRYVGNGRGPGQMPPVQKIADWIQRAGLDLSAWAVARKIAKEGSRAHRRGEANVFMSAAEAWEASGVMRDVEEAAGLDVEKQIFEITTTWQT